MKLNQLIALSLIVIFGIGATLYFFVFRSHEDVPILLIDEGGIQVDTLFEIGVKYDIEAERTYIADKDELTWTIDGKWYHELEVEKEFDEMGSHEIALYVNGKERGQRIVHVVEGDGARIDMPNEIFKGDQVTLKDVTRNSKSRKFYVDGEFHPSSGKSLRFHFKKAKTYDVKVLIENEDGEELVFQRSVKVTERRSRVEDEPRKDNYAEVVSDIEKRRREDAEEDAKLNSWSPPSDTEVERQVESDNNSTTEVADPDPVVETPEPTMDTPPPGSAFGDYYAEEFDNTEYLSWFKKGGNKCVSPDSEASIITIRDLQKDVCLTHIALLPNPDLKSNRVDVTIRNAKPGKGKARTLKGLVVQDAKTPYSLDIEEIGCGLLEGESYKITVTPRAPGQICTVSTEDPLCYDNRETSDLCEIQTGPKTKILKLTWKH